MHTQGTHNTQTDLRTRILTDTGTEKERYRQIQDYKLLCAMRTTRAVRLGASGVLCVADCLLGDILKLGALWGFLSFLFYFVFTLGFSA